MDDQEFQRTKEQLQSLTQLTAKLSEIVSTQGRQIAGMWEVVQERGVQVDAMRLVSQAAFGALAELPEAAATFEKLLKSLIEADADFMLAVPASDELIQRRADWIQRMVPRRFKSQ